MLLVVLASQQSASQETEEICGTWENGDYLATGGFTFDLDPFVEVQRVVYLPDGEMELSRIAEGLLERNASYTITSKRIDSDGNVVYEQIMSVYFEHAGKRQEMGRFYLLAKSVSPEKHWSSYQIQLSCQLRPIQIMRGIASTTRSNHHNTFDGNLSLTHTKGLGYCLA